jgi:hypothetical protein
MSDAELEKLEKDQEASRNALQADASEEEIAEVVSQKSVAAGKIRVAKKTAPAGEPAVTV